MQARGALGATALAVFLQLRLFDLGYKPIGIAGKYGKQTWKALFGLGEA